MESASESDREIQTLKQLRACPEIFREIADFPGTSLQCQTRLRSRYPDELVRAAIALHEARSQAKDLIPEAESLWLTRVALQQSTAREVARHKARRFIGQSEVTDGCSGIGMDASEIAQHVPVNAVEMDPAMA
ncbi:MAG: hypothetical protein KDA96_27570, partial [Planctomycetaceae bacterium]|nr:hypothetical protein [Planctomycetaceae bacterium]